MGVSGRFATRLTNNAKSNNRCTEEFSISFLIITKLLKEGINNKSGPANYINKPSIGC